MTLNSAGDAYTYTTEAGIAPGKYQYKFVVNGSDWIEDPSNDKSENGNSIVVIPSPVVVESPIVNADGSITFNLAKGNYTSAEVMGTVPGCSWTVGSGFAMTLNSAGDAYTYTTEAGIAPGAYEYKFVTNGSDWGNDPSGDLFIGGNNAVVVPGLANAEVKPEKGMATDLPAKLMLYSAGSTQGTEVAVTYTLDDSELADVVTIENNKITVARACTETEFTLTAKTENNVTSKVYVKPTEKVYTYTIYYYDSVEAHRDADKADMWFWEKGAEGSAKPFTVETLSDGNVWLKTVIQTPATEIGFIARSKGSWTWQTGNMEYNNAAKEENVTIYVTDTNLVPSKTMPVIEVARERYVLVSYKRANDDYEDTTNGTGWNFYSWNTGFGSETEIYGEMVNGEYIMKAPIRDSKVDTMLAFIIRKSEKASDGNKWVTKDGGDTYVNIPADQEVVKIYFEEGKSVVDTLAFNKSYEINGAQDKITFYYRDDAALATNYTAELNETVKVVIDGTAYEMTFDAENERYYYTLENCTSKDYAFSYLVGTKAVQDKFASNGVVTYKSFDDLSIEATLSQVDDEGKAVMDYNDNSVLTVSFTGEDASLVTSADVESITANLTVLGGSKDFAIAPELMEGTIAVDRSISAGQYVFPVVLKDKYGNTYETSVRVTVVERDEDAFDWDEAVIYMTVTDRFFDGDSENNEGVNKDNTVGYHGGDFAGLTAKLDYLKELGINTIWITPIVENSDSETDNGYHGYWASDFEKINSYLGDEEQFATLITEAHERDMKIMVDVVLNHAGYNTEDKFAGMLRDASTTITGHDIYSSLSGLPDFLTENEEVRDQLIEWQVQWMTDYPIDYYRVDTVKHVETLTWQAFKNELTKVNPDFKLIGEYYGAGYASTAGHLGTGTMDALLDFDVNDKALDFVSGNISATENFYAERNETLTNTATLGGFLSSHDENSFVDKLMDGGKTEAEALALAKVGAALQITAKGQVVIYYGEEIGQHGKEDYPIQSNRKDFNWTAAETQANTEGSMLKHYQKLLGIRNEYSDVFAIGTRETIEANNGSGYDVFKRAYEDEELFVALNIKATAQDVSFETGTIDGTIYTDLYSGATFVVADGKLTVNVPAAKDGGVAILKATGHEGYNVIIHLDAASKDYASPSVYSFATDGSETILSGGWPGTAMTANNLNEGWYDHTLTKIPFDRVGFVFNDNGSNQTADLFLDITNGTVEIWVTGNVANATITETAPDNWKVFDKQTLKLNYYKDNNWSSVSAYVHANGEAAAAEWPGTALTQNEGKWYQATINDITSSKIKLTMNDGGAVDSANKDADLDITLIKESTELWVKDGVIYTSNPDIKSPIIKGDKVTFNYVNTSGGKVYLKGSFDGWGAGVEMTDPDGDGVVSCTISVPKGSYQYKFMLEATGAWIQDPLNDQTADDGYGGYNSALVIGGLNDKEVVGAKKGEAYALPQQLEFVTGDGTTKVDVTYSLKNADDADIATLDGRNLTVSRDSDIESLELVATATVDGSEFTATVTVFFLNENAEDTNEITIKLHYSRPDGNYTDWNVWIWELGKDGKAYQFVEEDGEMVATVTGIPGRATTKVGYIVRKGEWKEQEAGDQFIDLSDIVSGTVHFYVESGVTGGTRRFDTDTVVGSKIVSTSYDANTNKVTVTLSTDVTDYDTDTFAIKCESTDTDIEVTNITKKEECVYVLTLGTDISSLESLMLSYSITFDNFKYALATPNVYDTPAFEAAYTYTGNDLGSTYSSQSTTFKVWAPTADDVKVKLYASGNDGADDALGTYDMTGGTQNEKGVWTCTVSGDLNGTYYTYLVKIGENTVESVDPYARTTGVNGKRAMVLNLDSTDPEGWAADANKKLHEGMEYTDAVIYELHIRDLSSDSSSGVSAANQGKYLGLTETGTKTAGGQSTALDHIIDLGITHLHILPMYDFGSVDESRLDTPQFNWGYDPVNYNVPEGSYSTDPSDGAVRVKEVKEMVKTLHDNNINVVMDVVYNHVYDAGTFSVNQIVPKYFSRTAADGSYVSGSGCGNDTASERTMVRKYIVDSILYWHEEYHIDGFRFDLVGLIDTVTIQEIVDEVHAVDPDILFYGEGWNMAKGERPGTIMATQANSDKTDDFAFFNDVIRNGIAGSNNADGYGFVFGNLSAQDAEKMEAAFLGKSHWCYTPSDTVNYASCHDNYTLMDKINIAYANNFGGEQKNSYSQLPGEEQVKLNNLSATYYMFAQGIPFIHAGEDMLRTKYHEDGTIEHNSYNSSDYVNKIRWSNLDTEIYADTSDYYEGIIAFRKNHESLRLSTPEDVAAYVDSYRLGNDCMMYSFDAVEGEVSDGILIIYNASTSDKTINIYSSTYSNLGIEEGEWYVCVNGEDAGTELLAQVGADGNVVVDSRSAMALVKIKEAEEDNYEVGDDLVDTDSVYTVNNNVTVSMNATASVAMNATTKLNASVSPANSTLVWTSANPDVATVDANGNVTPVSVGEAVITVATLHGVKATCTVTVVEASSGSGSGSSPSTPAPSAPSTPSTPSTGTATDATTGATSGVVAGATTTTPSTDKADEKVEVKPETTAPEEVPETVEEVTPIVDETLQDAIAEEAEQILEDIMNDEVSEEVMDSETAEKVKEAQENGESIITEILVEKMDESKIDAEVKEAFVKALTEKAKEFKNAETKIAQFLDLSVLLKTTKGEKLGEIHKLSKEMTFTIAVPEDLVKDGREFMVLRMHDGITTILETIKNADGTLSFKTDRFSTYALAYVDADDVADEGTTEGDIPSGSQVTPDDDDSNMATFIFVGLIIIIIAALAIIFFAMKGNKKNK